MPFSGLFRSLGAIVAGIALVPASPAAAHPSDEVVQQVRLTPATGTLGVELAVTPGPMIAPAFARSADTDGNSQLSAAETGALLTRLTASLSARVDGADAPVTITGSVLPPYPALAAGGTITVTGSAPMPASAGAFEIIQRYDPGQPTSVQMNVVLDRTAGRGPGDITRSDDGRAITVRLVRAGVFSAGEGTGHRMLDALREPLSSRWALLLIGVCAVLGAVHALAPGHGRTMLAAYPVGSRGTPAQTFAQAGVITLTHTGSVLLIGAGVVAAGHHVVPDVLAPKLQIVTGLIVLILGVRLAHRRWTDLTHPHRSDPHRSPSDRAEPHGSPSDRAEPHGSRSHRSGPHRHGRVPPHAHVLSPAHPHAHVHGPVNGQAVVQVLDVAPAKTRMRELAAMGAAGGLLPCPEALGVLILAAGLNRTVLGLGMIVAFSAGLAAVLVTLGLALVTARDRITAAVPSADSPSLARLSLLSAALVTGLGIALAATGLLDLPPLR